MEMDDGVEVDNWIERVSFLDVHLLYNKAYYFVLKRIKTGVPKRFCREKCREIKNSLLIYSELRLKNVGKR